MDHTDQNTAEHTDEPAAMQQGHPCGHHGHGGGQHAAGSEDHPHGQEQVATSALDILDVRFARGEIEKAEYEEKKQLISQRAITVKADVSHVAPSSKTTKTRPGSTRRVHAARPAE